MNRSGRFVGLRCFLDRHCPDPDALFEALGSEPRVLTLQDGERLCSTGDLAECAWIVEEGRFRILTGQVIARRGPGDLIGEMAFFRSGSSAPAIRGNDIVADGRARVWQVDRSALDGLPCEARALWFETVSRVLVAKLDEASRQRAAYADDLSASDRTVSRLVCPEGLQAVTAALRSGEEELPAVKTEAVIWFSDVAGFSTFSEGLGPHDVGRMLRSVVDPQIEEIQQAGGQVDKLMGDGLMAFWLCRDPARRSRAVSAATEAALRASARVREVADREGMPVGIRIGLHMGEVVVGDFGGGDRIAFTLVGQAVNSAARYEQYKPRPGDPDGAVRVSDVLFGHLPDEVRGAFRESPVEFTAKHDRRFTTFLSTI